MRPPDSPTSEYLYANRWRIWAVVMIGLFMALIDVTIVNISIPQLQRDLDAPVDTVSWVLNAYNIVFAVLLVSMGRLADQERSLEAGFNAHIAKPADPEQILGLLRMGA